MFQDNQISCSPEELELFQEIFRAKKDFEDVSKAYKEHTQGKLELKTIYTVGTEPMQTEASRTIKRVMYRECGQKEKVASELIKALTPEQHEKFMLFEEEMEFVRRCGSGWAVVSFGLIMLFLMSPYVHMIGFPFLGYLIFAELIAIPTCWIVGQVKLNNAKSEFKSKWGFDSI